VKIDRFRSAACALVFVSLALSGCGDGDKVDSKPPVSAAPAAASKPSSATEKPAPAAPASAADSKTPAKTAGPAAPASDKSKVLRFSGIPNQNTTELAEKYAPLAKYLSDKLAIQVEYVPAADYNATVDGFKNGDLQLCWFGGFTGVQARAAVPGARAIACGPRDMKFRSYFVANKSLGLKKGDAFPMAFKGHKFTFGSAQSTSGRLMPEYFIRESTKMSPKEFFGAEPSFSGSHDKTMELVAAGTYECGVVDYTVYDKRLAEKKVDPDVVQVIWTSPEFCDYQFTAHPRLEEMFGKGFTEKLQKTLISMKGDDLKLLSAMDRNDGGLVTCKNEDFDKLAQCARDIGLVR
jgi:phosphonate transport system substrate-binding protein